jgi:hypothetical protein
MKLGMIRLSSEDVQCSGRNAFSIPCRRQLVQKASTLLTNATSQESRRDPNTDPLQSQGGYNES